MKQVISFQIPIRPLRFPTVDNQRFKNNKINMPITG